MIKRILTLIAFVVWCWYSHDWYVCEIKQQCGRDTPVLAKDTIHKDVRPILFDWDASIPIINATFEAYKDSLLTNLDDESKLEIVGQYFEEETTPEGYQNMGLARAEAAKKLVESDVPLERIVTGSELLRMPANIKTQQFKGVRFYYLEPKEEIIPTIDSLLIVRFDENSMSREVDPDLDKFLTLLAELTNETDGTISITGHTDNVGESSKNERLGRARARFLREILIKKGVPRRRIKIQSKGELEPIADNDTERGRSLNRRAEIIVK